MYVIKFTFLKKAIVSFVFLLPTLVWGSELADTSKISLRGTNISLEQAFQQVEKQTGYTILYGQSTVKGDRKITVNIRESGLSKVMAFLLQGTGTSWRLSDRTIVLMRTPAPRQSEPVRGQVVDSLGRPIPGASVRVIGAKGVPNGNATVTDGDGNFVLQNVPSGARLEISFVGFFSKEIPATSNVGSVVLMDQVNALQEVNILVNTGFQRLSKAKMTGATVSIGSAELEARYTPNIMDNLEGRAPGLVRYRGTTTIRGVGTINANRNPLIVLDGLPIEGSIEDINPYDVADITILKDAAAAAIYGARAANGVIVVTSKEAKKPGLTIDFETNLTLSDKPDVDYNLLTIPEQIDLERETYAYLYREGAVYPTVEEAVAATEASFLRGSSVPPVYYAYYQWAKGSITEGQRDAQINALKQNNFRQQFKDNALLTGLLQQYNLAVRHKGDRSKNSVVLNYKTDNTGIINAYDRQLNFFFKGSYDLTDWLTAHYGANSIMGFERGSNSNFSTLATNVSPYQPLLDASGNRVYYSTSDYNAYNTDPGTQPIRSLMVNHLDELGKDQRNTRLQQSRYFINLEANVLPGLTLQPQFQYESGVSEMRAYSEADSYIMRYLKSVYLDLLPTNGGKLVTAHTRSDNWTARAHAAYRRTFGVHDIEMIGGAEFRQTREQGTGGLLLGYDDQLQSHATTTVSFQALNDFRNTTAFKPGMSTAILYNTYIADPLAIVPERLHRFNSMYANATYTYDGRYNVFGSYRVDYADVFGLDETFRGRPLWSAGLGWNLHREPFVQSYPWIDFLKLRATYGITGNIVQDVTSYLTATTGFINPVTGLPMSVVSNAANPELRWEKTASTNVGLDFMLFGSRLSGSLDWYRKKGSDLLVTQRLDPSEGFTSQIINNGGLLNDGIELSLQYTWLDAAKEAGWHWTTGLVFSKNKNRITYIDEVATTPMALVNGGYRVGYPVNALYSFQYQGLSDIGQPRWLRADGTLTEMALTSNDMDAIIYTGTTDPRVNMTLTNTLQYRGLSLNILAVYYGGHHQRALVPGVYNGVSYGSMPAFLRDRWTPENTETLVPGSGEFAPGMYPGTRSVPAQHLDYSDAFVRPSDFIKIRSAVLRYQLPDAVLPRMGVRRASVSFQVDNPKAIWTRNDIGFDPETGGAPVPTAYVFGINFTF